MLNSSSKHFRCLVLALVYAAATTFGLTWAQSMPDMPVLNAPPVSKPLPASNESVTTKSSATKIVKPNSTKTATTPAVPTSTEVVRPKVATLPPPSKVTLDFYNAVNSGNLELAEFLFTQGPDVNCLNCGADPALHLALGNNWYKFNTSIDKVEWLYKHGANMNLQDRKYGQNILHHLISLSIDNECCLTVKGSEEIVLSLQRYMAYGASPKVANFDGVTPLHMATRFIHITGEENLPRMAFIRNLFNTLVAGGADINAVSNAGYTPLMYGLNSEYSSYVSCNKPLVEHLIRMGSDIRRATPDGRTAYTFAYDSAVKGYKACNALLPLLSTTPSNNLGPTKTTLLKAGPEQKLNVSLPADLVGEWKGVLRIKSPSVMAVAVSGTMSADGNVQLNAPMGFQTVGVVTRADDSALNFRLHTMAPEGARFKNGNRATEDFDVSGTVSNRIYRGNYVAPTDSGEFILCPQDIAIRESECSPTFAESFSNLVGGLMGVLGGAK